MTCFESLGRLRRQFSVFRNMFGGRRTLFSIIVCVCIVLMGATKSFGQDLGALARQERLRKQTLPKHSSHVYTNDDLANPQILTPEDRAEFQITVPQPTLAPVESFLEPLKISSQVPLGDIARQYRERKLAR